MHLEQCYRRKQIYLSPWDQIKIFQKSIRWLLKVSSHEICHMFRLHHYSDCAMNGTNHLPETDAHPSRICPHCQGKIALESIKYDNRKRLTELIVFLGSEAEFGADASQKRFESFKPD